MRGLFVVIDKIETSKTRRQTARRFALNHIFGQGSDIELGAYRTQSGLLRRGRV
jgi:hypothetical protein